MLYIKFQTSEQSGSAEDFKFFFFIYFYGLNIGPPGAGPSCTQGPSFNQTWLRTTRPYATY